VKGVDIVLMTTAQLQAGLLDLQSDGNDNTFTADVKIGNYYAYAIHDTDLTISSWALTISDTATVLNDMWIVARYTLN